MITSYLVIPRQLTNDPHTLLAGGGAPFGQLRASLRARGLFLPDLGELGLDVVDPTVELDPLRLAHVLAAAFHLGLLGFLLPSIGNVRYLGNQCSPPIKNQSVKRLNARYLLPSKIKTMQ